MAEACFDDVLYISLQGHEDRLEGRKTSISRSNAGFPTRDDDDIDCSLSLCVLRLYSHAVNLSLAVQWCDGQQDVVKERKASLLRSNADFPTRDDDDIDYSLSLCVLRLYSHAVNLRLAVAMVRWASGRVGGKNSLAYQGTSPTFLLRTMTISTALPRCTFFVCIPTQ